ncbi:MAG: ZIP family metal transporter [Candidatus Pacearchaeota archaeon]|jgi:ZIP family zinc transporter
MEKEILFILLLSISGPIIGSLIGVSKKMSERIMYNMLAFSAGVMLAISFLELIPLSIKISSIYITLIGVFIGSLFMLIIEMTIPHIHVEKCQKKNKQMKRTALYLLIGLFFHNIPEGMTIAAGLASNIKSSMIIALAIAIQKIPEGICTSAPNYYCSQKRMRSFIISSLTIIPLIIGFLIGHFIINNTSNLIIGIMTSITAGLMIYITADELIPASSKKLTNHNTIFSVILGILLVIFLKSL